jgi:hypothetical protein
VLYTYRKYKYMMLEKWRTLLYIGLENKHYTSPLLLKGREGGDPMNQSHTWLIQRLRTSHLRGGTDRSKKKKKTASHVHLSAQDDAPAHHSRAVDAASHHSRAAIHCLPLHDCIPSLSPTSCCGAAKPSSRIRRCCIPQSLLTSRNIRCRACPRCSQILLAN